MLVDGKVGQRFGVAGGPMDLDLIDLRCVCQSEMDSQIVLREVAAATVNFVGLRHATGDDRDSRIQRETIALGAGQFKADPVTSWNSAISQDHRAAVDVADDDIHVPVVEQVSDCETARDVAFHQSFAGQIACVAEGAVLLIEMKHLRFAIAAAGGQRIDLRIDVTGDGDQVEPAIVVHIDKGGAPFDPRQGWQRDPRLHTRLP